MYLRTVLIIAVLGILTVLALLNWSTVTEQKSLSLAFTTVEAPLGLVLLGFSGLLTLLFLVYVVYLQSSVLLESRRYARELQGQRELAEQAEGSRLTELRILVTGEVQKLADESKEMKATVLARLDVLERELSKSVEQSGNTLAAYLGEIDDRIERTMGKQGPERKP
jgi:hypothetical protein